MTFDIDDPRLTAFALGELPESEHPEIEQALADHPDLAREVDQIRQTARWLSEQLHEEQSREAVAAAPSLRLVAESPCRPRFWRRYPWMSAVAALVMLGFSTALLMPAMRSAREQALGTHRIETDLARSNRPTGAAAAPTPEAATTIDMLRDEVAETRAGDVDPRAVKPYYYVGDRGVALGVAPKARRGLADFDSQPLAQAPPAAGDSAPEGMQAGRIDPSQSRLASEAAPDTPALQRAAGDTSAGVEIGQAANQDLGISQNRGSGQQSQPGQRARQGQAVGQGQGQGPGQGNQQSQGRYAGPGQDQSGQEAFAGMEGMMGTVATANPPMGMGGMPGPSGGAMGGMTGMMGGMTAGNQGQGPGMRRMQGRSDANQAGQAPARSNVARTRDGSGALDRAGREVYVKTPAAAVDSFAAVPAAAKPTAEVRLPEVSRDPRLKRESEARAEGREALAFAAEAPNAPGEAAQNASQPEALMESEAKEPSAAAEPIAQPAPTPIVEENPFVLTSQEAASTFAIDVDTASYSIVRRTLTEQNRLPSPGDVRIEELLNYFPYQDAPPPAGHPDPFAIHIEAARCPWNAANRLARVGIMGRPLGQEARKPSNLVFLVDVSGSMDQPNKLPLVQWGLQKLVEQLGENDRAAIAVYAGSSGLVLPSTSAMNKPAILSKIEELRAGGSTNGGAGIQLAYDQAAAGFINGGINRVILATDGDFNVGVTNQDELVHLVEAKAKGEKPIFLSVLGFGMDNLKDGTLEKLADKGNGHYAYIDRQEEAYKVLVEEMGATLDVIAKDVKIQVEFRPELVRAYRLVGYENRVMPNQDFRDDRKDGGEIGAGHHVTALYEYAPAEAAPATPADGGPSPASFTVRLRYKQPEGDVATEIERPVVDRGVDYADASDDFKFASAVAGFGMILRHSPSVGSLTLAGVTELATPTLAHDPSGYRREFLSLVQRARDIQSTPPAAPAP